MNRLWKLAIILVCTAVLLICAHLAVRGMPILPSHGYKLTVTQNGQPIEARLLHPPGSAGQYYIGLSKPPLSLYRWFHIDFPRRRVSVGDGIVEPATGPVYLRGDPYGQGLPSDKMEDSWIVDFKSLPGGVRLTGPTLTITLSLE